MGRWNNMLRISEKIQELKREAVLKEAGRAFSMRGYHNTSLDDVAKALHISKGSLYNYVKDKQEILFECHKIGNAISERALEHGVGAGGNGMNILRNVLTREIELLTSEFGAFGVLTEMDALTPENRQLVAAERNSLAQRMMDIIRQGIDDRSIRRVDPHVALMVMIGSINWLPRWFSSEGGMDPGEVARQMTDLLLNGLEPLSAKAVEGSPPTARRRRAEPKGADPALAPARAANQVAGVAAKRSRA